MPVAPPNAKPISAHRLTRPMTIARRLILLTAAPLLVLMLLGLYARHHLAQIETRSRFLAESQIVSVATLGKISRIFTEMRVSVRDYVLRRDPAEQGQAQVEFNSDKADLIGLLGRYSDSLVTDDKDRRLLESYQGLSTEWTAGAEKVIQQTKAGLREDALAALNGPLGALGRRLSAVSEEWMQHNEALAMEAGRTSVVAVEEMRRNQLIAFAFALLISGILGVITFRRIVHPIRSLQRSVESIAGGDYAQAIPFTTSSDETGDLARSVAVLKGGAAAMEEQR